MPKARRIWSEQEEAALQRYYHVTPLQRLASRFKTTPRCVRIKAYELGLTKFGEGLRRVSLAAALGCSPHTVTRWVKLGWLPARRRHTERQEHDWLYISDEAVRAFIMAHPDEIHPTDENWLWLFDMIAGGQKGIGELSNPKQEDAS